MKHKRVLILTDLHWSRFSIKITNKGILSLKERNVISENEKFLKVKEYIEIIDTHKPDIVLFGGDITGDGSCGTGYYFAFAYLLQYLENCKINSVFIQGNHDTDFYYNKLIKKSSEFKYAQEISGKSITIKGLTIIGVSFEDTKNKTRLKELICKNGRYDIVLAHAELARRPWLFDFETRYIITGHYDIKFNYIDKKIFLSFFNDFPDRSYAIIDFEKKKEMISYFLKPGSTTNGLPNPEIVIKGERNSKGFSYIENYSEYVNHKSIFTSYKEHYLFGFEFKTAIESLLKSKIKFKSQLIKLTKSEIDELNKLRVNFFMKISKTMIFDYMGESGIEK